MVLNNWLIVLFHELGFLLERFDKSVVVAVACKDEMGGGRGWSALGRSFLDFPSSWKSA